MSGHVLTLNAGSSSLKFGLFEAAQEPRAVATGLVDRIGADLAHLKMSAATGAVLEDRTLGASGASDHVAAVATVLEALRQHLPDRAVTTVGHRVVHGGPVYTGPVVLSEAVIADLETYVPFAPLHQPHNLAGVRAARDAFPDALQIACFDTSFHRSHPWVNDTFALPRSFYDKGVRRYGFHGLSYEYVSGALARIAPQLHAGRVVVAHLGNGASMCALLGGRSVASTMGFSALDGLPMGTRCGQLDPGVMLYLMDQEAMSVEEISDLLYRRSGLLGLSGLSNDMRTLEAADTPEAGEAIDYYIFRIRRELGGLAAALGGLDALVFCGGIGEHSALIRRRVCEGMDWLGIEIDRAANTDDRQLISTPLSRARVLVIPTNEEFVIARNAVTLSHAEV